MSAFACTDFTRAERILDGARSGGRPLSAADRDHLAECEACRVAVERMRRLVQTWVALEPTAAEASGAYRRLERREVALRAVRASPKTLALALFLIAAVAGASTRIASSLRAPAPAVTTAGGAGHSSSSRARATTPVAPPEPSLQHDAIRVEDLPIAVEAKGVAPNRHVAHDRLTTPTVDGRGLATATGSAWAAAAAALRAGDYASAERAFDLLAAAAEPSTRDAARLARAQVWLTRGRRDEAMRELEDLAKTGATALVRQRAAEELETPP